MKKTTIFAGWWQVAISMLTQAAAVGTIVTCFSVIAAPPAKEFGASRGELGLVLTLTILIGALINPMLGTAMDRFSIRKIMLGGSAALATGYLALSFATSMTGVFLAFGMLLALASAALGPLSYSTLLPRWFVARRARVRANSRGLCDRRPVLASPLRIHDRLVRLAQRLAPVRRFRHPGIDPIDCPAGD